MAQRSARRPGDQQLVQSPFAKGFARFQRATILPHRAMKTRSGICPEAHPARLGAGKAPRVSRWRFRDQLGRSVSGEKLQTPRPEIRRPGCAGNKALLRAFNAIGAAVRESAERAFFKIWRRKSTRTGDHRKPGTPICSVSCDRKTLRRRKTECLSAGQWASHGKMTLVQQTFHDRGPPPACCA